MVLNQTELAAWAQFYAAAFTGLRAHTYMASEALYDRAATCADGMMPNWRARQPKLVAVAPVDIAVADAVAEVKS